MTPQEKIQLLCEQAMKTPDPIGSDVLKEARSPEEVCGVFKYPVSLGSVSPQPDQASGLEQEPETETPVQPVQVETPEMLQELEERDLRMAKDNQVRNWVANSVVFALFAGAVATFALIPSLRGKVERVAFHMQSGGVNEVRPVTTPQEPQGEALDQFAVHDESVGVSVGGREVRGIVRRSR